MDVYKHQCYKANQYFLKGVRQKVKESYLLHDLTSKEVVYFTDLLHDLIKHRNYSTFVHLVGCFYLYFFGFTTSM